MSFFSKLFSGGGETSAKEKKQIPWNNLTQVEQLDAIILESKKKPVVIFKHSTRCGISRMTLRQFESQYNLTADEMSLYYLDLLNYRHISNEVEARFQVVHQSPQLFVIKNGLVVHHASHYEIQAGNLTQFV